MQWKLLHKERKVGRGGIMLQEALSLFMALLGSSHADIPVPLPVRLGGERLDTKELRTAASFSKGPTT